VTSPPSGIASPAHQPDGPGESVGSRRWVRVFAGPSPQTRVSRTAIGPVFWGQAAAPLPRSEAIWKRIAIIGGGIGGLTTAIALLKKGHEVRVFGEADELREVRAGIWVPPNAMQVLDRLGLGSAVEAAGVLLRRIEIRTEDGAVLQAIDLDPVRRR
jgi:NADPH-dependent 2,4-dienoyl-CoA reductase/sulfur reductase-like enzyme